MEIGSKNIASILRKVIAVLTLAIPVIALLSTNSALAGEIWRGDEITAWHAPAYETVGFGVFPLVNRVYEYPYDYGGYGEYAEYGRWAHRHQRGCYLVRQPVWTGDGWLSRKIQVCG